tara:strand:+ start:133 stop:801 length:669 start_codon:yes stop_codon:yes gene_type:complete
VKIEKLNFDTGTHDSILTDRKLLLGCLEQPFIYIRIPRTGSTSISKMLRDNNAWPHFYASLVRDLIGKEEYNNRLTFASVRNPWDRMVSWFLFNCNDYRANPEQSRVYRELGFKGWIMNGCPHSGWSPHHFAHQPKDPISQLSWIINEQGETIVDHVVRLESLKEDFEQIREKLGLSKIIVPRLNISSKREHQDYRKYYDWESKEKVLEMYGDDIRYFNYQF